jgi:hypothetical protein
MTLNTRNQPYDVFISYSHKDVAWVCDYLVPRLKEGGLNVCIDREAFDIGVPSLVNMENAVTASRHTLLVLTPNWMASEWTAFEHLLSRHTNSSGIRQHTIPVLRDSCEVPPSIAMLSYADFRGDCIDNGEWRKVLDALRGIRRLPAAERTLIGATPLDKPRPCDFYVHVSLPTNYVERPELLAELRTALLDNSPAVALTSAIKQKPTVLHGMGGIGKSVMARALCDDPDVQAAFPDGILWTTLGQTPELVSSLRDWINVLGGTTSETATMDSLKANLATFLKNRACLLIVDDVWQHMHAKVFKLDMPNCRLLITTRDAAIAEELGAKVQPIPIMEHGEAMVLLEEWANGKLAEVDPALKAQIVKELGSLPLAIKLAGAQLQRKAPQEWLRTFDARKLQARRPEDIHDSLEQTFGLSLDALSATDRRLYAALAIFKEDELIPEAGIARLWHGRDGLDEDEFAELLDDLQARALLEVSHDSDHRTVVLHDLLRDFIRAELGDEYISAHHALLNVYRKAQKGAGWHTALDDGYLYDHLAYHLDAVGDSDGLTALFADQHWMNVRVPQRGYTYDGYIEDLMLAWRSADAQARRNIEVGTDTGIAECFRIVLIRTSINALAGNYAPELVARAVEVGLWTPDRALSVAAQLPNGRQKANMCVLLLRTRTLSEQQRAQAQSLGVAAAQALDKDERRSALCALALHIDGQSLDQKLRTVLSLPKGESQALLIAELASELEGNQKSDVLEQGIAVVRKEKNIYAKARALAALAPHLPAALLDDESEAILAQASEASAILVILAPCLSEPLAAKMLEMALTWANKSHQIEVLAALAPRVSEERQGYLIDQVLHEINYPSGDLAANVIVPLACQIQGEHRVRLQPYVLNLFLADRKMARLAQHLDPPFVEQALDAARVLSDQDVQAVALAVLAPHLMAEHQPHVLERAVGAAQARPHNDDTVAAWFVLAPQIGEPLFADAVDAALRLPRDSDKINLLAALAPRLHGKLLQRVRKIVKERASRVKERASIASANREKMRARKPRELWRIPTPQSIRRDPSLRLDKILSTPREGARNQALASWVEDTRASVLKHMREKRPALQLPEELRAQLAVENPSTQAAALVVMRKGVLDCLLSAKDQDRRLVLSMCAYEQVMRPTILSPETVSQIVGHIIEICEKWKWNDWDGVGVRGLL